MRKAVTVAIIPNSPNFLQNRLFEPDSLRGSHAGNTHWLEPMVALRREAIKGNIILNTYDSLSPEKADIVVIMELPSSPSVIKKLRLESPKAKVIFMPIETPLGRAYIFNKANHDQFDAVLTYNHRLIDGKRYFHFYLPMGDPSCRTFGECFARRKPASMVCTNSLLALRTALNVSRAGWCFSVSEWWDYVSYSGELISTRRTIARLFERFSKGALDIYGDGWSKRSFASAKGRYDLNKLELLGKYRFNICYENCINDCGYISEKIFDALLSDTVPVYLGNKSIQQHIPKECFIDARDFRKKKELVRFICECPESVWEEYRRAGQKVVESSALQKFLPLAFVNDFLRPIRVLAGLSF